MNHNNNNTHTSQTDQDSLYTYQQNANNNSHPTYTNPSPATSLLANTTAAAAAAAAFRSRNSISSASNNSNNNAPSHQLQQNPPAVDLTTAVRHFKEAMELLPSEDRAAYAQAQQRCPHLIQTESPPLKFLLFSKLNVWDASKRLSKYWKWRQRLFQERAFLPLLQIHDDVEGAMDAEDVLALESGVTVPLPRDTHGRRIIFNDRTRPTRSKVHVDSTIDPVFKLRTVFFFLTQFLAENELEQQQQQQSILTSYQPDTIMCIDLFRYLPKEGLGAMMLLMVSEAFPFYSTPLYLMIPSYQNEGSLQQSTFRYYIQSVFLPLALQRVSKYFPKGRARIHVMDSPEDAFQKFRTILGMKAEGIPEDLGGTWSYRTFQEWLQTLKTNVNRTSIPPNSSALKVLCQAVEVKQQNKVQLLDANEAQQLMETAMLKLPYLNKAVYMEALEQEQDMVEEESPMESFFNYCYYNQAATNDDDEDVKRSAAQKAAKLLGLYWTKRKQVFGSEQAFAPIIDKKRQSSRENGDEDAKQSQRRLCTLSDRDFQGRTVLFLDANLQERLNAFNKQMATASKEEEIKSYFSTLTRLIKERTNDARSNASSISAATEVVLVVHILERHLEAALEHAALNEDDLLSAFPLDIVNVHILIRTCGRNVFGCHSGVLAYALSQIIGATPATLSLKPSSLHFHIGNESARTFDALNTVYGLPASIRTLVAPI